MNVHVLFGRAKHSVLVPIRFAHSQFVTGAFQLRQIRGFVRGVFNHDEDVDDRLRREARYGSRADMLDAQCRSTKRGRDNSGVNLVFVRPIWIVVDDLDANLFNSANQSCFQSNVHRLWFNYVFPGGVRKPTHSGRTFCERSLTFSLITSRIERLRLR